MLSESKRKGHLKGATVANDLVITHLLFVDDILFFYNGTKRDLESVKLALSLFEKVTGMMINLQISTLFEVGLFINKYTYALNLFHFLSSNFDEGKKYLSFHLKPNYYKKVDWLWLIEKIENILKYGVSNGFQGKES